MQRQFSLSLWEALSPHSMLEGKDCSELCSPHHSINARRMAAVEGAAHKGSAICCVPAGTNKHTDSIKSRASERLDSTAGMRRFAASTTHL